MAANSRTEQYPAHKKRDFSVGPKLVYCRHESHQYSKKVFTSRTIVICYYSAQSSIKHSYPQCEELVICIKITRIF